MLNSFAKDFKGCHVVLRKIYKHKVSAKTRSGSKCKWESSGRSLGQGGN